DLGVDLVLVEGDGRDAVLRREERRDLAVGDVPELGERVAEVLSCLALLFLGLPELLKADELFADEQFAEAVRGRHRGRKSCGWGGGESTLAVGAGAHQG